MRTRGAVLLFAASVLLSCGKEGTKNQGGQNQPPVTEGKRLSLVVFGGGYCKSCKTKFPEIQSRLDAIPEAARRNLKVQLYYVAGDPGSVRPTQEAAIEYRDRYMPRAEGLADLPWRWTNFKRLLPGEKLEVPAAVMLDEKGEVVKKWNALDTVFVPSDIVESVATALTK